MDNKRITKDNMALIKELVAKVENMTDEEYKSLLKSMVRFHNYSYGNQLILWACGASQVAGFQKWKSLKRIVKKGAKAIWILAPNGCYTIRRKLKTGDTEREEDIIIQSFKSVPVFDISQTEGELIEKGFTVDSGIINFSELVAFSGSQGCEIRYTPLPINIGGYINGSTIWLNNNLSKNENTGTLIHELSHYMMGHTAANDKIDSSLKEQEAETLTYLICSYFGIDRKSNFYLKSWGLSEGIMKSFNRINANFNKVIAGLTHKDVMQ